MTSRQLASTSLSTSTIAALSQAGYDTLQDIFNASPSELARELNISLPSSQAIIKNALPTPSLTQSMSQPVSTMISSRSKATSTFAPLNLLLSGGLAPGHVLELSGPPGSPKEQLLLSFVIPSVQQQSEVIFIDCQNMHLPELLRQKLDDASLVPLVSLTRVQNAAQLVALLHTLPEIIAAKASVQLIVISHLSFVMQGLETSTKTSMVETIRSCVAKLCASTLVTVLITSQLATKLLNADGTAGNFDTGSKAVLVPSIGSQYLPKGRSFQVMVVPSDRHSGHLRLLSSPFNPGNKDTYAEQPYNWEDILK